MIKKIRIQESEQHGYSAIFQDKDFLFHGKGQNKKKALQDLNKIIRTRIRVLDTERYKLLRIAEEADMIIHTPSLLEDNG